MSRDSRPPGFDMTFRPEESRRFGPERKTCVPSYVYLGLSFGFVFFVAYGYVSAPGSFAHRYVIEASGQRMISAATFATIILASGLGAVLRAHMRGVVVHPDGIETLDILALGWPKIERYGWAQIDKLHFDAGKDLISVDLWNGQTTVLPRVADRSDLVQALAYVAEARAIPYTGGRDDDDSGASGYRAAPARLPLSGSRAHLRSPRGTLGLRNGLRRDQEERQPAPFVRATVCAEGGRCA